MEVKTCSLSENSHRQVLMSNNSRYININTYQIFPISDKFQRLKSVPIRNLPHTHLHQSRRLATYTSTSMRFESLQIARVAAFIDFATAAPVGASQDVVEKRFLPPYTYALVDKPASSPGVKRVISLLYEEFYRSITKTE